jgi:hypothetical protein
MPLGPEPSPDQVMAELVDDVLELHQVHGDTVGTWPADPGAVKLCPEVVRPEPGGQGDPARLPPSPSPLRRSDEDPERIDVPHVAQVFHY